MMGNAFVDSLLHAHQHLESEARISALHDAAKVQRDLNPSLAIELFDLISKEASEQAFVKYEAQANYHLGKLYREKSKLDQALIYLKKAKLLAQSHQLKDVERSAINMMGWVEIDRGNFKYSKSLFERSLKLAQEANDSIDIAVNLNDIGASEYYLGNKTKATELFLEAAKIREDIHYVDGLMVSYNNLGVIYKQVNLLDRAQLYYERGAALAKGTNNLQRLKLFQLNSANLYLALEDYPRAKEKCQELIQSIQATDDPIYVSAVTILGDCLRQEGKLEESAQNLERIKQSEVLLVDTLRQLSFQQAYGQTLIALGDYQKGIELLEQCKAIQERKNMPNGLEETYSALAEGYSQKGLYQQAFENEQKLRAFKDSLINQELQSKVVQLQFDYEAKYDTKQKQIEINILQREQYLQQVKLYMSIFLICVFLFFLFQLFYLYRQKISINRKLRKQKDAIAHRSKELKVKNEELTSTHIQLKRAAQAKEEFLANMSHEIRTPMNAVVGLTNVLLDENPRPDQIENLQTLQFSATNLLHLINDILDFSKIESGKVKIERIPFSLEGLIRDILETFRVTSVKSQVDLRSRMELMELSNQLIGDPTRLTQILTNLLSNALKFTREGHVELDCRLTELNREEATIFFEVRDTGIGIPQEKLDQIFESFTQANDSTTRLFGGTGLGLTITKKLIELQGGKIAVESEIGQGSSFYFTLSFPLSEKSVSLRNPGTTQISKEGLEGIRVLVAEDNKINQMVAKKILTKWGIHLTMADDGIEALRMVQEQPFDLILMDINMPNMDGYEATLKIRELGGAYAEMPIIALTASIYTAIAEDAAKVGLSDFVGKPFRPEELFEVMHNCLYPQEVG